MKTKINIQQNMENTAVMPTVNKTDEPTTPPDPTPAANRKDHWLVEVAGGVTLAGTMVSALSLWFLMLQFVVLPS